MPESDETQHAVDAETVGWFKGDDPKGYTARMAAVLRAFVVGQRGDRG